MEFYVSHYKRSDKELYVNGGTLYVKNSKIVLKNMFITVAVFDMSKIIIKSLPDELLYKSLEFSDDKKSYVLLFNRFNYKKLSEAEIFPLNP